VSDYRLVEQVPSVEDYNRIRVATGLTRRDPRAAEIGLSNTVFGVCVERDGRVVGIGRIVGDGGLFFEVVDVAVVPVHQKRGLGKMIMDTLTSWLHDNAPPTAYVKLIADVGTTGFYEKYGFRIRTPESSGMSFMTL
jgi:GNAT superfamily N-acetyltransferase